VSINYYIKFVQLCGASSFFCLGLISWRDVVDFGVSSIIQRKDMNNS